MAIYHTFLYQPIYNILVGMYALLPWADFGVAIILVTLLMKLALYPLSQKQIVSQKKMQDLQPKIKDLQKRHKDNKEEQAKKMMELYKEHNVNPVTGCLPLIVQLLFFIALYRVIINISQDQFTASVADLYSFVPDPGAINHFFLGFLDLTVPNITLAIVTALAQWWQMKMILGKQVAQKAQGGSQEADFTQIMNKQMLYVTPAISLFIGVTFPAALALYWLTSTVFMLVQQTILLKPQSHE